MGLQIRKKLSSLGRFSLVKRPKSDRLLGKGWQTPWCVREAEKANIPFLAALPGALRRCSSLVWLATLRSECLALHPASAPKNGTLAISASLSRNKTFECFQSSRNGITPNGLITELHGFFVNAWPACGLGMLSTKSELQSSFRDASLGLCGPGQATRTVFDVVHQEKSPRR